jgi:hypothetical protein
VYDDKMKLKKECEDGKSENSREDNGERKPSDSAKPKSLIKPVESGGKNRGVKKVSSCDDSRVEVSNLIYLAFRELVSLRVGCVTT